LSCGRSNGVVREAKQKRRKLTDELRNAAILDSVEHQYHAILIRSIGDSWEGFWQVPWEG
jgi:hypothetical protein